MKKAIAALLSGILLTVSLCGCGGGETPGQPQNAAGEGGSGAEESRVLSQEDTVLAELLPEEEVWKDNSLDPYTALLHTELQPAQPEGELGGGIQYVAGSGFGALLKKHVMGSAEESWDELKLVDAQEGERSLRLAFRENSINQAMGMGGVAGSDHLILWNYTAAETAKDRYVFFEIDADQQIVREIPVHFLADDGYESPLEIMVDGSGNLHLITGYLGADPEVDPGRDRKYCMIADAEGNLLAKLDYTGTDAKLLSLYDGRVVLLAREETGSRLDYADPATGEATSLAQIGTDAPEALWERGCRYTLLDEETLLFADDKGLYSADLTGNDTKAIYLWNNHAIRFSGMEGMEIAEDGRITLLYRDYENRVSLLWLEPTTEQVELQKIIFAVDPNMRAVYSPVVTAFNKKYPAYRIELKADYDRTALATELMAGRGPVLVDTMLTGFDNHRELWTPLGSLFSGGEWEDALIPQAMGLGEIDGTLYGVPYCFSLETVVIPGDTPVDWDYGTFLDAVEAAPSLEAIFNGENNAWTFLSRFMIHGLEDNYLLDYDSGSTFFDSGEFRRALGLGMKYCREEEYIRTVTPMLEGKVFCNTISIQKPELVDLYRICYGADANYIGYPSRDGAAHYIDGRDPVTVRVTASDEEKRIAGTFLRMLLSQDCQRESAKDPNFYLSVRRDVLQEQIDQVNESSRPVIYGFEQITLGDDYDREYDARMIYGLLENARPQRYFPAELRAVIMEEMEAYMAGDITEDVLIERLTKRVELYLAEQS